MRVTREALEAAARTAEVWEPHKDLLHWGKTLDGEWTSALDEVSEYG